MRPRVISREYLSALCDDLVADYLEKRCKTAFEAFQVECHENRQIVISSHFDLYSILLQLANLDHDFANRLTGSCVCPDTQYVEQLGRRMENIALEVKGILSCIQSANRAQVRVDDLSTAGSRTRPVLSVTGASRRRKPQAQVTRNRAPGAHTPTPPVIENLINTDFPGRIAERINARNRASPLENDNYLEDLMTEMLSMPDLGAFMTSLEPNPPPRNLSRDSRTNEIPPVDVANEIAPGAHRGINDIAPELANEASTSLYAPTDAEMTPAAQQVEAGRVPTTSRARRGAQVRSCALDGGQVEQSSAGVMPATTLANVMPATTSDGVMPTTTSAGVMPATPSAGVIPRTTSAGVPPATTSVGVMPATRTVTVDLPHIGPVQVETVSTLQQEPAMEPFISDSGYDNVDHYFAQSDSSLAELYIETPTRDSDVTSLPIDPTGNFNHATSHEPTVARIAGTPAGSPSKPTPLPGSVPGTIGERVRQRRGWQRQYGSPSDRIRKDRVRADSQSSESSTDSLEIDIISTPRESQRSRTSKKRDSKRSNSRGSRPNSRAGTRPASARKSASKTKCSSRGSRPSSRKRPTSARKSAPRSNSRGSRPSSRAGKRPASPTSRGRKRSAAEPPQPPRKRPRKEDTVANRIASALRTKEEIARQSANQNAAEAVGSTEPANEDRIPDQPANEGRLLDEPANEASLPDQLANVERLLHHPANEERLLHQPANEDRPLHHPVNDDRLLHQPVNEQSLPDQPANEDRPLHQPANEGRLLNQPANEDRSLPDQPANEVSLLDVPVDQERPQSSRELDVTGQQGASFVFAGTPDVDRLQYAEDQLRDTPEKSSYEHRVFLSLGFGKDREHQVDGQPGTSLTAPVWQPPLGVVDPGDQDGTASSETSRSSRSSEGLVNILQYTGALSDGPVPAPNPGQPSPVNGRIKTKRVNGLQEYIHWEPTATGIRTKTMSGSPTRRSGTGDAAGDPGTGNAAGSPDTIEPAEGTDPCVEGTGNYGEESSEERSDFRPMDRTAKISDFRHMDRAAKISDFRPINRVAEISPTGNIEPGIVESVLTEDLASHEDFTGNQLLPEAGNDISQQYESLEDDVFLHFTETEGLKCPEDGLADSHRARGDVTSQWGDSASQSNASNSHENDRSDGDSDGSDQSEQSDSGSDQSDDEDTYSQSGTSRLVMDQSRDDIEAASQSEREDLSRGGEVEPGSQSEKEDESRGADVQPNGQSEKEDESRMADVQPNGQSEKDDGSREAHVELNRQSERGRDGGREDDDQSSDSDSESQSGPRIAHIDLHFDDYDEDESSEESRDICRDLTERRISPPSAHTDATLCQITAEMPVWRLIPFDL